MRPGVANFYYERFHDATMFAPKPKGTVPTGVAVFTTADFAIRPFAEKTHNITHWSEYYSGGHFPALEVPHLLTGDIRAAGPAGPWPARASWAGMKSASLRSAGVGLAPYPTWAVLPTQ
jgi:hypothetical protein